MLGPTIHHQECAIARQQVSQRGTLASSREAHSSSLLRGASANREGSQGWLHGASHPFPLRCTSAKEVLCELHRHGRFARQ